MTSIANIHLSYRRDEHATDPETARSELATRLRAAFSAPGYEPPKLPEVGVELLRLSRSTDVDIGELLELLEKDALLAARVLRIARSPVFAGSAEVRTLHQAVMRLGLRTLSDLVLEAGLTMTVFRARGYESVMTSLARHSTVVAHLSRYICSASSIPDDFAFLCGLMHDVGIAASVLVIAKGRHHPKVEQVWPTVEAAHVGGGTIVAQAWDLPREVAEVIHLHHEPFRNGAVHSLAAVVALADGLAIEAGFGYRDEQALPTERLAAALGISGERFARLRGECIRLAHEVASSEDGG